MTAELNLIATAATATPEAHAEKDTAGRLQRAAEQGKRLTAIYLLAVNAGLRTVEISRLNVKDVFTLNGQSYLNIYGKGHAAADTKKPIAGKVKAAIDDYLDARATTPTAAGPLFVSTGNRSGGRRIAPSTISKMLKKAMQAADIGTTTAFRWLHEVDDSPCLKAGDS